MKRESEVLFLRQHPFPRGVEVLVVPDQFAVDPIQVVGDVIIEIIEVLELVMDVQAEHGSAVDFVPFSSIRVRCAFQFPSRRCSVSGQPTADRVLFNMSCVQEVDYCCREAKAMQCFSCLEEATLVLCVSEASFKQVLCMEALLGSCSRTWEMVVPQLDHFDFTNGCCFSVDEIMQLIQFMVSKVLDWSPQVDMQCVFHPFSGGGNHAAWQARPDVFCEPVSIVEEQLNFGFTSLAQMLNTRMFITAVAQGAVWMGPGEGGEHVAWSVFCCD